MEERADALPGRPTSSRPGRHRAALRPGPVVPRDVGDGPPAGGDAAGPGVAGVAPPAPVHGERGPAPVSACRRFETEGLLRLESGETLDEHFERCPDCLAARTAYE